MHIVSIPETKAEHVVLAVVVGVKGQGHGSLAEGFPIPLAGLVQVAGQVDAVALEQINVVVEDNGSRHSAHSVGLAAKGEGVGGAGGEDRIVHVNVIGDGQQHVAGGIDREGLVVRLHQVDGLAVVDHAHSGGQHVAPGNRTDVNLHAVLLFEGGHNAPNSVKGGVGVGSQIILVDFLGGVPDDGDGLLRHRSGNQCGHHDQGQEQGQELLHGDTSFFIL